MTDCLDIRSWRLARRSGLLRRLIREDSGQDLVEYALLAGTVGIAGWLTLQVIDQTVFDTYSSWIDPTIGTPSVWEPPEPPPAP